MSLEIKTSRSCLDFVVCCFSNRFAILTSIVAFVQILKGALLTCWGWGWWGGGGSRVSLLRRRLSLTWWSLRSLLLVFFFFLVRCNGASRLRWHCLGPDLRAGVVMAARVHPVCLCMMLHTPTHKHTRESVCWKYS